MPSTKKNVPAAPVSSPSAPSSNLRGTSAKEDAIVDMLTLYIKDWRGAASEAEVRRRVHNIIGGEVSTVDDYLNRLIRGQRIVRTIVANPFKSKFVHQYQQALSFSFSDIRREKKEGRRWSLHGIIHRLIKEANAWEPPGNEPRHFHIIDGVILFGAEFDVLLTIITDDGAGGITQLEQEILAGNERLISIPVSKVSTWPVSYSYRWGYPKVPEDESIEDKSTS